MKEFVDLMNSYDSSIRVSELAVINNLRKEHVLFEQTLERGIKVIQKNPDMSEKILLDTYGLSSSLIRLIKKGEGL